MRKALLAFLAVLAFMGSAAATGTVWNTSDTVIQQDDVFTSDAFTAENLTEFNASIGLDTNESLEATLKGYNDSEMTGNQSFTLSDGENSKVIDTFEDSTSTYVVDFNASGGDVTVLSATIGGDSVDNTPSGVAPGQGGFLEGIPLIGDVFSWMSNAVNSFIGWLANAWAA